MNLTTGPRGNALIVGASGGVARAVLAVLAKTAVGRSLAGRLDEFLLLDAIPAVGGASLPPRALFLPPAEIRSAGDLERIVRENGVDQVIDLSSLDTLEAVAVCDAAGASYLDTSIEHWPGAAPRAWHELVLRAMPPARPALRRGSFLVGSGMNPGIVNALVFAGIEVFASRVGVAPTAEALRLHAILFTEDDTTVEEGGPPSGAFPMTWSPAHCLEELLQPDTLVVRRGRIAGLGHAPLAAWYRARCADRQVDGFVVPHEEVLTLAPRFPDVELGFVYRLPPAARAALASAPGRNRAGDWRVHRMYPPHSSALQGRDRVGVLLCSHTFGELWIGYEVDARAAARLGTNATQLQVAAGVVAGWAQLGRRKGIHFVEDLDWRLHLAHVDEILGPPAVVHDPHAPALALAERRVRVEIVGRPAAQLA